MSESFEFFFGATCLLFLEATEVTGQRADVAGCDRPVVRIAGRAVAGMTRTGGQTLKQRPIPNSRSGLVGEFSRRHCRITIVAVIGQG
ncbi:MAG: hypothetical protein ABI831_10830 [Betaproteobacteria bacterium]